MKKRRCGILMHLSSLPSKYGIGTIGAAATRFVDFLKQSNQTYWQVLPMCLTDSVGSAYQSYSTFAGNINFIDLDSLKEEGYLNEEDYAKLDWGSDDTKLDFEKVNLNKLKVLKIAYENYIKKQDSNELEKFCDDNEWVDDFSAFMTLREINSEKAWWDWEKNYKFRDEETLENFKKTNKKEIYFWIFTQFIFFKQWFKLKKYANDNGIEIIGDLPIYVSGNSADVWANPENFCLDATMHPIKVSGCPPDHFSKDGQLWGNPIYAWVEMKKNDYSWWTKRFEIYMKMYDITRIDHFKGFDSYYSVDANEKTAKNGEWIEGPRIEFFKTIEKKLGKMKIIAEDLGYLTESTKKLLEQTGYPGMKILQFAFDDKEESCYLPHTYDKNSVAYVGTHDNNTAAGWFEEIDPKTRAYCKSYLNVSPNEPISDALIRGIMASVSNTAIVQMQDWLGLGASARFNTPSTTGGLNWKWRAKPEDFSLELIKKISDLTKLYCRSN